MNNISTFITAHSDDLSQTNKHNLFLTISGSHLYGTARDDSDIDLRGTFAFSLHDLLGIYPFKQAAVFTDEVAGIKVDASIHEIGKFAQLILGHNGNTFEELYSPLVVYDCGILSELRTVCSKYITADLYHHYRGFLNKQLSMMVGKSVSTKDVLYAYRIVLTGIHVLETGEIVSNLPLLFDAHRSFVGQKVLSHHLNNAAPPVGYEASLLGWSDRLGMAYANCKLPKRPKDMSELNDLVVKVRKEYGNG